MIHGCARREHGLTLLELLVVIAIVGILASIAVPSYTRYIRKSRTVEAVYSLGKIAEGAKIYFQQSKQTVTVASRELFLPHRPDLQAMPSVGGAGGDTTEYTEIHLLPESSANGTGGWIPNMTHSTVCQQNGGVFPATTTPQFAADPWRSLYFTPASNFRYRYRWLLAQQGTVSTPALGYGDALGDLNCDQRYSVWRVVLKEERSASDKALRSIGPLIYEGSETD
jgi:prepilin-type N-terminal cleavage/methylation domain-containing protein